MKLALAIASFASILTVMPGQLHAAIEWELRYPFRLFDPLRDEDRKYFRDYSAVSRDWQWRKQLFVDETCLSDKTQTTKVLCSEYRLGRDRLKVMKAMIADPNADNMSVVESIETVLVLKDWRFRVSLG